MDSVKILKRLIRFNTTNPPGNEAECIKFIAELLRTYGIESKIVYRDENRLNLIARVQGTGECSPMLFYGHVDVVSADKQNWKYPPFEGVEEESCIWGRGALDMKGAIAMMLDALIKIKTENIVPKSDLILCVVSDEEDSGAYGAKFVVEEYPELFEGVKYAFGEIGGFTLRIGSTKFYPIMVCEKQRCGVRMKIKGTGGHGSIPISGGTASKLADILKRLEERRMPLHYTEGSVMMLKALAENCGYPHKAVFKALLNPHLANKVLDIMGDQGRLFDAVLHNTANATIIRGGDKINVIPSEITVDFDIRILPGLSVRECVDELRALISEEVELEVLFYDKGPADIDMALFNKLSAILKKSDVDAVPIPFVVSGVTDARFFSTLGIQTYGFTPMVLPPDMDFSKLIHSENERIPIEALKFGSQALFELMKE